MSPKSFKTKALLNLKTKSLIKLALLPVDRIWSTYTSRKVEWREDILVKRDWFDLADTKPSWINTMWSLSNQARGTCFNPYNALWSLHTIVEALGSTKPGGCSMYTSSCDIPFRKALFTSNCLIHQPYVTAIARIVIMVVGFTTGVLKVSLKSKPANWWNPFAARSALYFLNCTIRILFDFEYPFVANGCSASMQGD